MSKIITIGREFGSGGRELIRRLAVKLQKEMLKLPNVKKDYEPIAVEIDRLREEKQSIMADDTRRPVEKITVFSFMDCEL